MRKNSFYGFLGVLLSVCLVMAGCGSSATDAVVSQTPQVTQQETAGQSSVEGDQSLASSSIQLLTYEDTSASLSGASLLDVSDMFTSRDREIGYDEDESVVITLTGDGAQCDSDLVSISGSTVIIRGEGTFIISGTLTNGMVAVDANNTDKIQLVLSGASISCETSAAIYVKQADKVFITLASGTENSVSNGGSFIAIDENNIDSAIFSKDDLTLNGLGSLSVNSPAGHGIVGKDDLVITSGNYNINALNHGLDGKDSVRIAGGSFVINSGKDAVHAENDDDATSGLLYISGGNFDLTSDGDGLSAASGLQIDGGSFAILSGSGSGNMDIWSDNSASAKGVKAEGALLIRDGKLAIDASDDGIHSNGNVTIAGGSIDIATGDDAVHADQQATITGGIINITDSYEGIEGLNILISGGDIRLVSSDDGLNAAGGNDQSGFGGRRGMDGFGSTSNASITIEGGTVRVNASGDGIDSNGSIIITGGETYVSGPENSGNGAVDYASEATISGGIFIASGASGMAQGFSSSSTQGAAFISVDSQSGQSAITLTNASGETLANWTPEKSYNSVVISCPGMIQGETYTLSCGSYTTQFTLDSLVYNAGGGWGGGRGMGGGGRGGRRGF
ncbi:MAG: carbohydrate-binding domain-containing protein [Clostridia bacterium]|nr:carbohydrate-binding domain-containing protein [Clostridia bacterium]